MAPAVLLCLNLFFFGAANVFYGNQGEFLVEDEDVLLLLLLPATLAVIALTSLGWLFSRHWPVSVGMVFYFLAIVTYVHGNLIRWETGLLDGNEPDFEKTFPLLADAAIWLLLGILLWRCRDWLLKQGWKLCILLAFLQLASAIHLKHNARYGSLVLDDLPPQFHAFNSTSNVLHIILDGFQGSIFESVVEVHPEFLDRWRGFVHFRDALTPSPVTYLSVPATLSGRAFDNNTGIRRYLEETMEGENLNTLLHRSGYAVDVATPVWWNAERDYFSSYYRIPAPFVGYRETLFSTAMLLLDISLFRQVPYLFRPAVYQDGAWLFSGGMESHPGQNFKHIAHLEFLTNLGLNANTERETPTYKQIHLITPHAPMVSNADCSYSGRDLGIDEVSVFNQSYCLLQALDALFEHLKSIGIYDDSLIIMHGDHGGGVGFPMRTVDGALTDSSHALERMWGNPLPLVLIKKPGAEGPLRTDEMPVALTDIPTTVANVLNLEHRFPGRSMFSEESTLRRRMFFNSTQKRNAAWNQDRFSDWTAYAVDGSIFELGSWSRLAGSGGKPADSSDSTRLP